MNRACVTAFLRSFLIQGSWNNRTMIGGGFAFAILPVLRKYKGADDDAFKEAIQRHSEHFNAHPYLANLALGAACRMEEDNQDPEEIRRFKLAIRGPLGSMGDALIWVGWRPATVLAAVLLALAGAPPIFTVLFFLGIYNIGHLTLRSWGFRVGRERGSQIGDSLRVAALARKASQLAGIGVFLLGGAVGLALGRGLTMADWPVLLLALVGGVWGLWLGSLVGQRGWRWTIWGVSGAIALIFLVGWLG
ncbi:MAG: PTS system mannose/fructose/sorbose family transporter subunit IID [Gemmatimonadota bacterium]|jgi:PTS system mannose-specific IID component